jgi:Fe-Mn family superoxide dismutase
MISAVPLLVLDMYEHAYYTEFGANAAAYIDTFIRLIDGRSSPISLRGPTDSGQPRAEDSGSETLPSISVEELRAAMPAEQPLHVVDARPRNYVSKNSESMPNAASREGDQIAGMILNALSGNTVLDTLDARCR